MVRRYGTTLAERQRLVGAVCENFWVEDDGRIGIVLQLTDGHTMRAYFAEPAQENYDAFICGGVPALDVNEIDGDG